MVGDVNLIATIENSHQFQQFTKFLTNSPNCLIKSDTHLVVQRQFTEAGDVLGPLHQYQQLLLHGFTHVVSVGHLLLRNVHAAYGT